MLALVAIALAGATACDDNRHPRLYPRWVVDTEAAAPVTWRDCAGLRAFVRKSGKEGIGVTLEVRSRTDCALAISRAELVLADGTRAAGLLEPLAPLRGRSLLFLWMPVRFDGDAAWNRGTRKGQLELDVAISGVAQPPIVFPVSQLWTGPYVETH